MGDAGSATTLAEEPGRISAGGSEAGAAAKKVINDSGYEFGDLTRGAIKGFEGAVRETTGNKEYKFGDVSKTMAKGLFGALEKAASEAKKLAPPMLPFDVGRPTDPWATSSTDVGRPTDPWATSSTDVGRPTQSTPPIELDEYLIAKRSLIELSRSSMLYAKLPLAEVEGLVPLKQIHLQHVMRALQSELDSRADALRLDPNEQQRELTAAIYAVRQNETSAAEATKEQLLSRLLSVVTSAARSLDEEIPACHFEQVRVALHGLRDGLREIYISFMDEMYPEPTVAHLTSQPKPVEEATPEQSTTPPPTTPPSDLWDSTSAVAPSAPSDAWACRHAPPAREQACMQDLHEAVAPPVPVPPPAAAPPTPPLAEVAVPTPWAVTRAEKIKYDGIFEQMQPEDGKVGGTKVAPVLKRSGLDQAVLRDIWYLVDVNEDGLLDADWFAVAMHLTMKMKKGEPLPLSLPEALIPPSCR